MDITFAFVWILESDGNIQNFHTQGVTYSFVLLEKERMEFDDSVQKQTKNVCYVKEESAGVKYIYIWVIQQQELLLDKFNQTVSFQFCADGEQMLLLS